MERAKKNSEACSESMDPSQMSTFLWIITHDVLGDLHMCSLNTQGMQMMPYITLTGHAFMEENWRLSLPEETGSHQDKWEERKDLQDDHHIQDMMTTTGNVTDLEVAAQDVLDQGVAPQREKAENHTVAQGAGAHHLKENAKKGQEADQRLGAPMMANLKKRREKHPPGSDFVFLKPSFSVFTC